MMATEDHVELTLPVWQVDLTDRLAGGLRVDGFWHVSRWDGEYVELVLEDGSRVTFRNDAVVQITRRRTCSMCVDQAVAQISDAPSLDDEPEGFTQLGLLVCELHRQHCEHYGYDTRFLDAVDD